MYEHNAGIARGLSIATLILSILLLVLSIICAFGSAAGTIYLLEDSANDNVFGKEIVNALETTSNADAQKALDQLNEYLDGQLDNAEVVINSEIDATDASYVGIGVMAILTIGSVVLAFISLLPLIASILGIRRAKEPARYGAAFVWAVIATIFMFFTGQIVLFVLCLLMAVYENKAKQIALYGDMNGMYGGNGGNGSNDDMYGSANTSVYMQQQSYYGNPTGYSGDED